FPTRRSSDLIQLQPDALVGGWERAEERDGLLHLRPQTVTRDLVLANRPYAIDRPLALRIQEHDFRGPTVLDHREQVALRVNERAKPCGSHDHDVPHGGVSLL